MEHLSKAQLLSLLTPEMKEEILRRVRWKYRVVVTVNETYKIERAFQTEKEAEEFKERQLDYWKNYVSTGSICCYITRELDL